LRMARGAIEGLDVAKPEFAQQWAHTVFEKLTNIASEPELPEDRRDQLRAHAEKWKRFAEQWATRQDSEELKKTLDILGAETESLKTAPKGNSEVRQTRVRTTMNLRHAAALTLVGWYLMLPPLNTSDQGAITSLKSSAPISEWDVSESYDSATECRT